MSELMRAAATASERRVPLWPGDQTEDGSMGSDKNGSAKDAISRFSSDNWWLIPLLSIASGLGTFLLTKAIVALISLVVILAVLFVAAMMSLSKARGNVGNDAGDPRLAKQPASELQGGGADKIGSDSLKEEVPGRLTVPGAGSPDSGDSEDQGEEEALSQAVDLALAGKVSELRALSEADLAGKTGEERVKDQSFYLYSLVVAGDKSSLNELRKLVESKASPGPEVLFNYALSLASVGEPQKAADALVTESESFSVIDKASAVLQAAELLLKDSRGEAARTLARSLVDSPDVTVEQKARAWHYIGESQRDDQPMIAIAAFEQSLQLDPMRSGTRFDLAYVASHHGLNQLSRHHYAVLANAGNVSGTAINNLGVAQARLGLTGRAVANYRKAGAQGAALAYANYAQALIVAGDWEGAEDAVKEGEKLDENDARVISARTRLVEARAEEDKQAEKLTIAAAAVRRVVSGAAVISSPASSLADLVGSWSTSLGHVFSLEQHGNYLQGSDGDDWLLKITREGDCFAAVLRPGKYATEEKAFMYVKDGEMNMIFVEAEPLSDRVVVTGRRDPGS